MHFAFEAASVALRRLMIFRSRDASQRLRAAPI